MDGLPFPFTACEPDYRVKLDTASADRPAVLIVSADPLVGQGVLRLLEHAGSLGDAEICDSLAAARTGPAVTLVVVDPATPGLSAERVANLVARHQAKALLAAGLRHGCGLAALRSAGARGVLTGTEAPALCARMIALVLAGGSCWSADPTPQAETADRPDPVRRDAFRLIPRQRQVADKLVRGHSNKAIAHALGIGEGTVKIHVTAILKTLGVLNRAAAVARLVAVSDPTIGPTRAAPSRTSNPALRDEGGTMAATMIGSGGHDRT